MATGLAQHFTLCSFLYYWSKPQRIGALAVELLENRGFCIISHLQVDFPALMGKAYTGWEWVGAGMAHVYSGVMISSSIDKYCTRLRF